MARGLYPLLACVALVSACGGGTGAAPTPSFTHDGPTLLAAAAGNLEGSPSFRLKMSVVTPAVDGRAASKISMNGVWDAQQRSGRMDGTLKGTPATVVTVGDTEFVSLTPALRKQTGKNWLGSRGTQTFDSFPDVHRVAAILRSASKPTVSGPASGAGKDAVWKVSAIVDRASAEKTTPDPTFKQILERLPERIVVNAWVANDGKPTRIQLVLAGQSSKIAGLVELTDFGARPNVQQPTANQVTYTLPKEKK